jgi:hypothetical protein
MRGNDLGSNGERISEQREVCGFDCRAEEGASLAGW